MSNPPSYDSMIANEIQDITPTQKANAQAKMIQMFNDPSTTTSAAQEVDSLTSDAIKIDQAFQYIRLKLVNLERVAARDQWIKIQPLVGGWVQLQNVRWFLLLSTGVILY